MTDSAMRFSAPTARFVGAGAALVFALLGLALAFSPEEGLGSQLFGVALGLGAIWFAWRSARSATVVVSPAAGVTTRSVFRTRRYPAAALASARVGVGNSGPNGWGRQYLVLVLGDGSQFGFTELNARAPRHRSVSTVVERCVVAINEVVSPPPHPPTR